MFLAPIEFGASMLWHKRSGTWCPFENVTMKKFDTLNMLRRGGTTFFFFFEIPYFSDVPL